MKRTIKNKIIINKVDEQKTSAMGIFITDGTENNVEKGVVVYDADCYYANASTYICEFVSAGTIVHFRKNSAIDLGNNEYLIDLNDILYME